MSGAQAFSSVVERCHDVAGVGEDGIIHLHHAGDAHRHLLELLADGPLRCFALNGEVERQGLGQSILVRQVDNLVVAAHVQVGAYGQHHYVLGLRLYDVGGLAGGHPSRHVLDGVGMLTPHRVLYAQLYLLHLAAHPLPAYGLRAPAQRVAVHEEGGRIRRCHVVAVHVGNVRHGDVQVTLVDATFVFVDVHHQLVVAAHEVEVQVLEFLEQLHRCAHALIHTCQQQGLVLIEHGVALIGHVAVHVGMYHLVHDAWLQHNLVLRVALLLAEAQVGDESLLRAQRCLGAVALDEVVGQCLCKDTHLVDIARQRIVLTERLTVYPHFVAQEEVVARHAA